MALPVPAMITDDTDATAIIPALGSIITVAIPATKQASIEYQNPKLCCILSLITMSADMITSALIGVDHTPKYDTDRIDATYSKTNNTIITDNLRIRHPWKRLAGSGCLV